MRYTLVGALLAAFLAASAALTAVAAAAAQLHYEVPGNPGNAPSWTFRHYENASVRGPNLTDHKPVLISCRVKGQAVSDGDVWWYRIAAKPWSNRYYVSADDFYNDGRSSGSLHGTPFYDAKVPVC